ncbi:MAG TPA: serine hydrolase domain-containing protein, partial [Pirellulales bacterium]
MSCTSHRLVQATFAGVFLAFAIGMPATADEPPRLALPEVTPAEAGLDRAPLQKIDEKVAAAIEAGDAPGAVVLIGWRGKVVYLRAYGRRQVEPEPIEMTVDTVFDLASLTKPIATATSIMRLVEQEKLALADPVANHIPEFGSAGKENITVEQLLIHQSGLIPDNALNDYQHGKDEAWRRIYNLKPIAQPG